MNANIIPENVLSCVNFDKLTNHSGAFEVL